MKCRVELLYYGCYRKEIFDLSGDVDFNASTIVFGDAEADESRLHLALEALVVLPSG